MTAPVHSVPVHPGGPALATEQATDAVRVLIFDRELLPGEQIRQDSLSARLGLSRSPVREALRSLTSEGLVTYSPRQGYFVSRLSRDELRQIYLMREVLERELLRRIPPVPAVTTDHLDALNADMRGFAEHGAITRLLAANREFHAAILRLSGQDLVCQQVQTLWARSESYRANYLWAPEHRARVIDEHADMVQALRAGDLDALGCLADQHRRASADALYGMLPETDRPPGDRP